MAEDRAGRGDGPAGGPARGHEAADPRRRVGAGPGAGPRRDLAAGPGGPGRSPPAVAVLVLRLEARAVRRDVRPGLRAAPRRRSSRSSSPATPHEQIRRDGPRLHRALASPTSPGPSCCSSARCPASSRRPESYALASRFLDERAGGGSTAAGFTRPEDLDLYTALVGGLVNQQMANDPGGTRWVDARGRSNGHVPGARNGEGRDQLMMTHGNRREDDHTDRSRRGDADHRGRVRSHAQRGA